MPLTSTLTPPVEALKNIEAFLMPGDPSPSGQGTNRYWQKVFALGLEDLETTKFDLKNCREAGWRCLIAARSGQGLYATFDSANKLTGLSRGAEVTVALEASRELRTLPELVEGSYELRVLAIPGLLTESFWLKSRDGKEDLIVPFFTSQELRCGHPYSVKSFLKFLRPLAEARLRSEKALRDDRKRRAKIREERSRRNREAAEERLRREHEKQLSAHEREFMAEERRKRQQPRDATTLQQYWGSAIRPLPADEQK